MKAKYLLLTLLFSTITLFSQDSVQTFLSVQRTGVEEFHRLYPEYDGRGTIIFILDTGVDMGIEGLVKTSTGEIKVIDAQDFTGEGDIKLYQADVENEDDYSLFVNDEQKFSVKWTDKLTYQSVDEEYYIGVFEENRLKNSGLKNQDINGNNKPDDKFYLVAFETMVDNDKQWIVYFDTNGNGDLSDEIPLRDYKIDQQSFTIVNEGGLPQLTFALNIFPEKKIVNLHFDDGAHGTHVAGITSGYLIGGENLNGIAPGAKIISCKLGNNLYAGGATISESMKNAYLYADKISKEMEEPCIINMSFGIGSEIEGQADMELFLADLLKNNPYLYVCVSNGNEGPGISSTGLPSATDYALSSGAILNNEVGRDLYGTSLDRDIILYFSSRGGEVNKPDIVSPGACTSTVPNWTTRDRFWGTSMASPYSAGVVSLLLSAAQKDFPGKKIPSLLLFKAIKESATKMDGYTPIDQGGGMINVFEAYKLLGKYINDGEIDKFETYTIVSTAPNMPNYHAPNLYLRNGSFLGSGKTFNFTINRNNFQNQNNFHRTYNLTSNSEWLIPIQKKTYIRHNTSTLVTVKFDKTKMTDPGLYCSKIKALRDDKTRFPEFEMLATVVIPYRFGYENDYQMTWQDKSITAGSIDRYFLELPDGQTSMKIELARNPQKYSMTRYRLYDPDGKVVDVSSLLYSLDNEMKVENIYYNLSPGVYELDVEGYFRGTENSDYNLSIQFYGINRLDNNAISQSDNNVEIINCFNNVVNYNLVGEMTGYKIEKQIKLSGEDHYSYPFALKEGEAEKEFVIKLSKEDFNKITDFSILIYDSTGKAVDKNGLTYKEGSVSVSFSKESGDNKYELHLIPAFANAPGDMTIIITEKTKFVDKPEVDVTFGGKQSVSLYPEIMVTLQCSYVAPKIEIPKNANPYGSIYFISKANEKTEYELPIIFNLKPAEL